MSDLIPQPHGGALRAPYASGGDARGASRKGASFRALKRECRELMSGWFTENVALLQDRCRSEDERVSMVALAEYFDRFLGKKSDAGLGMDDAGAVVDVSHLSQEDRTEVGVLLARLAVLTRHNVVEE